MSPKCLNNNTAAISNSIPDQLSYIWLMETTTIYGRVSDSAAE